MGAGDKRERRARIVAADEYDRNLRGRVGTGRNVDRARNLLAGLSCGVADGERRRLLGNRGKCKDTGECGDGDAKQALHEASGQRRIARLRQHGNSHRQASPTTKI